MTDQTTPSTTSRDVEQSSTRTLFVASTGGHLAQLHALRGFLAASDESIWLTFDNSQSRSLLAGRDVRYVGYVGPRDWRAALRAVPTLVSIMRSEGIDHVVSTGAAIAVPALIAARILRLRATYIESVSRVDGPSLTGRIMQRVPGVRRLSQHRGWAHGAWSYEFCALDAFEAIEKGDWVSPKIVHVFVTLGTIRPYRFDSLVEQVMAILPSEAKVTWQLGCTEKSNLQGVSCIEVTGEKFDQLATAADVVISHAGVGSAMRLLDLGVLPVLVVRRASRGEHVDDHQAQIARELSERGLAVASESGDLSWNDCLRSSSQAVRRIPSAK